MNRVWRAANKVVDYFDKRKLKNILRLAGTLTVLIIFQSVFVKTVFADTTPPVTTLMPSSPDSTPYPLTGPLTLRVTCQDEVGGSGCGATFYCIMTPGQSTECNPSITISNYSWDAATGASIGFTSPIGLAGYGQYTVRYRSRDIRGNLESIKTSGYYLWQCSNPVKVFRDADGDGAGDAAVSTMTCGGKQGYVQNDFDCNDNDKTVVTYRWYRDADGDGRGVSTVSMGACMQPDGYAPAHDASIADDCDDSNATETDYFLWTFDGDGDGFARSARVYCGDPSRSSFPGYVAATSLISISGDCNDSDALVTTECETYSAIRKAYLTLMMVSVAPDVLELGFSNSGCGSRQGLFEM